MTQGETRKQVETLLATMMNDASAWLLDGSLVREIGPYVDRENLEAKSAEQLFVEAFDPQRTRLLDYGCGAAAYRPFFEALGYRWTGVDYLEGVASHARDAVRDLQGQITLYDGKTLPYAEATFDVISAMFVLHHLRHLDAAFAEIARVLAPGGLVIGQVSSMEQMQDYSTSNITPFGLKVAAETAGLRLRRIYPKHDVFSFLLWRLLITTGAQDNNELARLLNPDGAVYQAMINAGRRLGRSIHEINLLRINFSAQYVFEIEKLT